jgi:hypothetical protein
MAPRPGELLSGVAAAALLVFTFIDWYALRGRAGGLNAWQAFSVLDLFLAAVIALALALVVINVAGRGPTVPVGVGVLTAIVALATALLVLYRILNQPGPNELVEVRAGAWLGLAAVAGVFAGAWWGIRDESPRPADPPAPEPEHRPAPPRA